MANKGKQPKSTLQRIVDSVKHQDDCWLWGSGVSHGYSSIKLDQKLSQKLGTKSTTVHRAMYILYHGDISNELVVDHLCGVRNCVNPDHLEAVSQKENVHRAKTSVASINLNKKTCLQGHAFDSENTYIHPTRKSRHCKKCQSVRVKSFLLRKEEAHRG